MRIGVSPALSCPPRARLVVAAPSSPCCRARVIDADVVITSTWSQSSPCPRRRRAVVPAPSSPSSPRHRPRTVISVPLLNPHPYPHPYGPCLVIAASSSPRRRRAVVASSLPARRLRRRLSPFRWFAGAGRMGGTAVLGLRHRLPFPDSLPLALAIDPGFLLKPWYRHSAAGSEKG